MGREALPDGLMPCAELARYFGKGTEWMCNELRKDSMRDIKQYPFSVTSRNEKTGQWTYRIVRKRFERWWNGEDMGTEQLISLIATIMKRM